ncbi:type IV pilus modification protein PilV [Pseudoduganella sp.]|uniref:type IV pilus modification protein PilV n=1 Tax=Pseudoduganella sp. TaxID=1880898 RepID=UPI0035B165F0
MRRPTAGFTMVEVLVAVLLLAVGLVGALAMQAHAMRTRQESALQTEALQAAATLADRIRANATQSSAYLGFEFDAALAAPGPVPGEAAAPGACSDAPCDAAALVQRELDEFRLHLQASLPSARAVVCRDGAAAMQWACSGGAEAPIAIKIGWRSQQAGSTVPQFALRVAASAPGAPPGPAPEASPDAPPTGGEP